LGPENEKVPVNEPASVVPVIVPFQSRPAAAHVPVTEEPLCVMLTFTADADQFDDSRLPVQLPAINAGGGGGGGLGAVGEVDPPQPQTARDRKTTTSAVTKRSMGAS
jgi:hypothetical protein